MPSTQNKPFLSKNLFPLSLIFSTLLVKLIFSCHVYGTNDVTYWIHFAKIIKQSGTFEIYGLEPIYNHPPLVSWILKCMPWLMSVTHLEFPFLFRLLPILADCGSLWVIWKILDVYGIKNNRLIFTLCALNPVNFLVSAFHGNTDPVFVFLVLLAVYFYETKKWGISGAVYGLSLCIKIVPILAAPVLFLRLDSVKKKLIFFFSAGLVVLAIFLPYLIYDFHAVTKNIFGYASLSGNWGLGHIFRSMSQSQNLPDYFTRISSLLFQWHAAHGTAVYFILLIASYYFLKLKERTLTEGIFFSFCLFLTVTPGFGVQYLSWLSFLALMVLPALGALYALCGGFFLYRVYTFWSGGFPMNNADSDAMGQWTGFDKTLDLIVWFVVLAMLIQFISRKRSCDR